MSDLQGGNDTFDQSRAEVFEALSHPTRIRIVQSLSNESMGFAELKRDVGIDSNGLMAFHLGKLGGLVKQNSEGSYVLTDEGKEALRIIEASKSNERNGKSLRRQKRLVHIERQKLIIAVLLVILLILGSFVFVQQEELSSVNSFLNSSTVSIGGSRYWAVTEPLVNMSLNKSYYVDGVNFTTVSPLEGQNLPLNSIVNIVNSTDYVIPGTVNPENTSRTLVSVPEVVINFGDGRIEYWNNFTEKLNPILPGFSTPLNITISFLTSSPSSLWISQHNSPRAGIEFDARARTISFFVGAD